jgi:hypothetical protein
MAGMYGDVIGHKSESANAFDFKIDLVMASISLEVQPNAPLSMNQTQLS